MVVTSKSSKSTCESAFDRMACAWLIRRFIDPEAQFKFVAPRGYQPAAGELRFDMAEGEFTQEGGRCSFEVLLGRFGLGEPALNAIAEIVHDLDLKDGKYGRPEADGIAAAVAGIALQHRDDRERTLASATMFNALYAYFSGKK